MLSLLNIAESYQGFPVRQGLVLLNEEGLRRKLRSHEPHQAQKFEKLLKQKDLTPILSFISTFENFPLDTLCGEFPTVLKYGRATLHALKLSRAVFVTLQMFRLTNVPYPQRIRGGKYRTSSKNMLATLFNHYSKSLRGLTEEQIVKAIKTSLARKVSISWNQNELPTGDHYFDIFPSNWKKKCMIL